MAKPGKEGCVSAAFFCPQTTAADEEYLSNLYAFLNANRYGKKLLEHIAALADNQLWDIFASQRSDVRELTHGPKCLAKLRKWAIEGDSGPLAAIRTNITSLPLLAVLQIGQYLCYLEVYGLSHKEFVENIRNFGGGVHGYCGGLPAAISIACANDENELIGYLSVALKLLVAIGAYTEAADEDKGAERTLLAVRLKNDEQAEELTRRFPGTYISGITGPRSISIGGPAAKICELYEFVTQKEGLRAHMIDLGGSAHNPANMELAAELCSLCRSTPGLQLPEAKELKVPLRSNQSGEQARHGSLTDDLIYTMLAARCEWLKLLEGVAQDLKLSNSSMHRFAIFGWADCVAMAPFFQQRLQVEKVFAKDLMKTPPVSLDRMIQEHGQTAMSNGVDNRKLVKDLPDHAIAVVGASCRLPGANNMDEFWELISLGKDTVQELPNDRFNLSGSFRGRQSGNLTLGRKFYGNFIDDVKRFDHAFFGVSAREAASLDPQQRLMLELSYEALDDAGYLLSHKRSSGDDVGCFIGLVLAEYMDNTNSHAATAYTSTGTVPAFLCGRISHFYGWTGPSEMFNTACSSSMVAINRACKAIQTGECRMAVAGGVNTMTGVNNYLDLGKAGFLSPTGQCKPFDVSADGYCRADGAGLVVLKTLKDAIMDGDFIWGVIPGIATNQGGLSASLTIPHPDAQKSLYRKVLQQAGFREEDVTYIEAHGTGTQAGDPLEMESIRSVFGGASRLQNVYIGSIKANIGHSEPAAGVAGLLKVLAMLRHTQIPPQVNYHQLNPKIPPLEIDKLEISTKLRPWDVAVRAALVNSYGAAGSNGALLCCDVPGGATEELDIKSQDGEKLSDILIPLLITAASKRSVLENAQALSIYFERNSDNPTIRLQDIAYVLNQTRQRHRYYASVKVKTVLEASRALRYLGSADVSEFSTASQSVRPVVLAFSGQTNRTIGLSRSIYERFPIFRSHIDACDVEFRKFSNESLLKAIFQTAPVENTAVLQCGIFATQYACARSWIDSGLQPCGLIGHSLGELTAYVVSGILSLADGIKLIATRGELIEAKWGPEKGAMLALECTINEFEMLLSLVEQENSESTDAKSTPQLEIACFNGPTSLVVAGPVRDIATAEGILRTELRFQKIRYQRLNTSHGFHSMLIEPILNDLQTISQSLTWNEPTIPIFTCTENTPAANGFSVKHHQDPSQHARQPVFFANAVTRVETLLGPMVWLEAGFDSPVTSMIKRACKDVGSHIFQAAKTQNLSEPSDVVAEIIESLWNPGRIFLGHWGSIGGSMLNSIPTRTAKKVWLPPYQFEKVHHWIENIDRAAEMQHLLEESKLGMRNMGYETPNQTSLMPPLVMRSNTQNLQPGLSEFVVNTHNPRYKKVVGGHVVCSQPLCPAPLYMELATLALQQLLFVEKGDSSQGSILKEEGLSFEDLRVNSPLGMDPPGTVFIQLQEIPERKQTWKMTVSVVGPSGAKTVNVDAIIALITNTILEGFQRLVSRNIESLLRSDQTEKLQCSRAYKLFERVVKYDHFYMAMQSIEMKEHEAVATVELPKDQPHREENEAWQSCDAVLLDACIHVCGLLINTSSSICSEDVAVMVGLDRAVLSPSFGTLLTSQLTVLASFNTTDQQQHPIGDVFVCIPQGELVAMFTGCHMTCLPVTRLEKIIGAASKSTKGGKGEAKSTQAGQMSSSMPTLSARSEKDGSRIEIQLPNAIVSQGSGRHGASALKKLVSECTLIETSNIPEDTALELIGLDSLGAAELSEELSGQLNLNIDPVNLLKCTISDLQKLMGDDNDEEPIQTSPNINNYKRETPGEILGNESQTERREMSLKVLLHVLHETSGAGVDNIEPRNTLTELGIDSLSKIDLKEEIETHFMVQVELNSETTVGEIMKQLKLLPEPDELFNHTASKQNFGQASIDSESVSTSTIKTNPLETLSSLVARFDGIAVSNGVANYWSDIAPFQDELALAYIIEGFASLGVDLRNIPSGEQVPLLPYISPKYDKLVRRLWEILQRSGLVTISNAGPEGMPLSAGTITRSSRIAEGRPASQLLEEFGRKFPFFHDETRLIGLTGPQLANCLSGKTDSVALMFGNSNALKIMEDYYGNSPISATLTEQLCVFLTTLLLQDPIVGSRRPVRILEVGGGTGGTTKHLAEALEKAGISTEYTFTDISSSLVKKAKGKLERKYPWISYATLNLEDEVRPDLLGQFDIALATNTVHATTDRIASCRRLRETLKHGGGLLVLAELTCHIDWCDICFGLLDGWWLADGPIAPLQTAEEWMSTYSRAGFTSMAYSSSSNPRTNTAQLLVACNTRWESSKNCVPVTVVNGFGGKKSDKEKPGRGNYRLDTAVYKEIDGVQIHADIYYPKEPLPEAMPIALMIHGGGHMTLSRRAVRPAQTRYLLKQGLLPVSIDYRLCPEVNLSEGPITDVRDAYAWVVTVLPQIALESGIRLDRNRVVAIGWSTGGHLAMSLGWTAQALKLSPPSAILSFYGPVDFESGELDNARFTAFRAPQRNLQQIISSLPMKPTTNSSSTRDRSDLGWICEDDIRSDLLLTISQQGIALPVLLNGIGTSTGAAFRRLNLTPPGPEQIASISPLARLRAGDYSVPTFIAHGTRDEVAPFSAAERFVTELRSQNIRHGFLPVHGSTHIFDVDVEEGTQKWENTVAPGYLFLLEVLNMA